MFGFVLRVPETPDPEQSNYHLHVAPRLNTAHFAIIRIAKKTQYH